MIRKLVLPTLAAALLAGCATDYAYRGGDRGDYYYGQPSTQYRYDGGYGGYSPYGYGSYGAYGYPYRQYGVPYGYGGYYNRPYYPYYPYYRPDYHRPPVVQPRPDDSAPPPQHRGDDRRPPWRNFDELRRRQSANGGGAAAQPGAPVPARPAVAPRERGSRMEQVIRRANRNAEPQRDEEQP